MATLQQVKEKWVDAILANPTYLPASKLMVRLKAVLLKLSSDDLANLKLVVEIGRQVDREGE